MVLSLLAPLLVERGDRQRIDVHRWDHYLGKLRDRKYTEIRRHGSYNYETINEAISISFDHLDEDTRHSLKDFVIFLDDVNIPAPVSKFYNELKQTTSSWFPFVGAASSLEM